MGRKVYKMLSKKNYISSVGIYIIEKLNRNAEFNCNFSLDCDEMGFLFFNAYKSFSIFL